MPKTYPTAEEVREVVNYSPKTGIFTWRIPRRGVKAGTIVGNINKISGYRDTQILGVRLTTHRLAFLWMGESIPPEVDHINHIRDDNRWENLRPATHSINHKNKALGRDNTSGHVGVSWDKSRNQWMAFIKGNGKNITLGRFTNKTDAIAAREKAEVRFGFHPNHGLPLYPTPIGSTVCRH